MKRIVVLAQRIRFCILNFITQTNTTYQTNMRLHIFVIFLLFKVSTATEKTGSIRQKEHKLGDRCYHVFLDAGSNIGVHGRFLFEPEKYPEAKLALGVYDKYFGPVEERNNRDICVFAFEPNPAHRARQLELKQVYRKFGWRYHFENVALSNYDGNITFHHQGDKRNNEWGFSFHKLGGHLTEIIPTIRFKTWLEKHIQNRIIPRKPKDAAPPKVVMKFDIEGGEYNVLMDLLFSGTFCQTIDYAFGESHRWIDQESLREVVKAFHKGKHETCKTKKIDFKDSEVYYMDGMPLPDVRK